MDPQRAGRLDAEWEQFVEHGGRPWWWREMDPTTGRDECFFEGDPEWEKSWILLAGPGGAGSDANRYDVETATL